MPVASKLAVGDGAGDGDKLQLDQRAHFFFSEVIEVIVDSVQYGYSVQYGSASHLLEIDLQLERVLEVDRGLLGDVLHVLDLKILRVVVRVLEHQFFAVEVDLGAAFELPLVIEQRVVRVHHDLAVLGVELVGEGELDSHQTDLARCFTYHQYMLLQIRSIPLLKHIAL